MSEWKALEIPSGDIPQSVRENPLKLCGRIVGFIIVDNHSVFYADI